MSYPELVAQLDRSREEPGAVLALHYDLENVVKVANATVQINGNLLPKPIPEPRRRFRSKAMSACSLSPKKRIVSLE
jgi:hypothetical protein